MLRVFASPGLPFTNTFLRPALSTLGSCHIFLTVSVYLFLLMMLLLVTVQSRLMRPMLLSLAWLRASLQALMVCQWNFMLLSEICLVRILLMFSMLLWRLASFLSLSVSFLVWLECVFLGRLCWLYCGLLGSVFFFVFFFCFSVCVFHLFAPPRSPSLAVPRFSWALGWLCLSVFPSCLLYIAFYTVYSL